MFTLIRDFRLLNLIAKAEPLTQFPLGEDFLAIPAAIEFVAGGIPFYCGGDGLI